MLCISEVMPGRYLNNRGYLPAYLPVCLTSVSRHFAVAWQYCCRSVAILLLWRGNLVVVAWQYCCCSVATFRGCSSLCCTNIASDKNLPRNTQNPQNLLADKSLPRISQMYTVFSSPPVVSVCSVNSVGRYFCGCVGMAGMPYPPNLCTSVQSVGVFVGGYGIPAIPTLPSEFLPQNPFQVCLRKSSHGIHGIHGIHRNFWRRIFSHGFHRIHRSFWRRRASHRFHRCAQMVRLRRLLWEDSLVAP